MLICVAIIVFGVMMVYFPLACKDCEHCWKRDYRALTVARCGVCVVVIGCLLVCYQFSYWGLI